jgi:uncharacterized protein (DUF302 family)
MFRFIWNLLALIGLLLVAGMIYVSIQLGDNLVNLRSFDSKAPEVYLDMARKLIATGNAAEATVWKFPVKEGLKREDVEQTMQFVANEHNIKNVGELPLSEQVAAMTGKPQRYLKIYMFCNPLTAADMFNYSSAFSAYLPCRVSLIEDPQGKLWLYTLNMDMMIYGGKTLPEPLRKEAIAVKETILDIMKRGSTGEF